MADLLVAILRFTTPSVFLACPLSSPRTAAVAEAQRIRAEAERRAVEEEKHAANVLAQAKKLRAEAAKLAEDEVCCNDMPHFFIH